MFELFFMIRERMPLYLLYLLFSFYQEWVLSSFFVLCPAEVVGAGAEFEVVFGDTQVHLGIADEGEVALG